MQKNTLKISKQGWFNKAEWLVSPNQSERVNPENLKLIVIHGISLPPNQFGGDEINRLFTNTLDSKADPYFEKIKDLRVSSHLLIRRDGSVMQYVPFLRKAWHAGISRYGCDEGCNEFSIGIELEGTDFTPYTAIQYQALVECIEAIWQAYPQIPKEAVTGHSDIAPGRKTDPGQYFMWSTLQRMLNQTFVKQISE